MNNKSLGAICFLLFGLFISNSVRALPIYAQREHKPCIYCHMNDSPNQIDPITGQRNSTTRNPRGLYYGNHNHTFAGYNELAVMGKNSPPVFDIEWMQDLPAATTRIAVANVKADKVANLITLNSVPGEHDKAQLNILHWTGTLFASDFSMPVNGLPSQMEVLSLGNGKAPAILTQDGMRIWQNGAFKYYPAPQPLNIVGKITTLSGTQRLVVAQPSSPVMAYKIDPSHPQNWLVDPIAPPVSSLVHRADLHANTSELETIGLPSVLALGGITDLWDVRNFGKLFLYYISQSQIVGNDGKPLGHPQSSVVFLDPASTKQNSLYQTPSMPGTILDVSHHDPRSPEKRGLLILTDIAPDGKGTGLYFYLLD